MKEALKDMLYWWQSNVVGVVVAVVVVLIHIMCYSIEEEKEKEIISSIRTFIYKMCRSIRSNDFIIIADLCFL